MTSDQDNGRAAVGRDTLESTMWDATAEPEPKTDILQGRVEADVAVVGSGIIGMSTALHLAEAGKSVTVLEAKRIGWGCSSRNGGHMGSAWTSPPPDEAIRIWGQERGDRLNRLWTGSGKLVEDLIEKHGIDCNFKRTGMVWAAENGKQEKLLADMAEQWGRYGLQMDFLSRQAMTDYVATDQYISGALTHENASINPADFVRGLARAAMRAGAVIHAGSPAIGIEKQGDRWRVSSPEGEVLASRVVFGTNAYTVGPWPGLARTFYPVRLTSLATEPCAEESRSYLLKGMPLHDMNSLNFFALLMDPVGRLLGGAFPTFSDSASIETVARPFERKFRRIFPAAPLPKWRHIWHGTLCMMPDKTPRMYKLAPGAYAVMGLSGTGNARAAVLGREVANLIDSGEEETCGLWLSKPKTLLSSRLIPVFMRYAGYPVARALFR